MLPGSFLNFEASLQEALVDPSSTQQNLLFEIIQKHQNTEFGASHNFSTIKTIKEFRNRIPVSTYNDYKPQIDRMLQGHSDVLISGTPVFWAKTSGTSGTPKYYPFASGVTQEVQNFVGSFLGSIEKDFPNTLDMGISILGQYAEDRTPSGVVIGSMSGFTRNTYKGNNFFDNIPMVITEERQYSSRYYSILLLALSMPLTCLSIVNPSTAISLFQKAIELGGALAFDLERGTYNSGPPGSEQLLANSQISISARPDLAAKLRSMITTGVFRPSEFWPNLKLVMSWQGGNTNHYLEKLSKLMPKCTFRASPSGSSEAALLIPLNKETKGGYQQ